MLSEVLKTNTTLAILNLEKNVIGRKGMKELRNMLKTNTTLTSMNVDCKMA